MIAVAAVDRYGTHAAFSTRRWYATVSAPGVDIVVAAPDQQYYVEWGTSAASAFVSGAVALVRAAHPGLSPAQIKKLLADTARGAPASGRDDARGYGIVDPAAAIEAGCRAPPRRSARRIHRGRPPEALLRRRSHPRAPREQPRGLARGLAAGGLGAVLLALAVVLWRDRGRGPFSARG